jgi:hypothetical protein
MVGLRLRRLFLQRDGPAVFAEFDDAVTLGILDAVAEDGRAVLAGDRAGQQVGEVGTEEDIVAQY